MSHDCRCGDVDSSSSSRESRWPMEPMSVAISRVLTHVEHATRHAPHRYVKTNEADGFVAAQDRHVTDPFPPFPASTMDGYAVLSADGACTLSILDSITAGRGSSVTVTPGTAAYITTGAPVPNGADCVVPIEWTAGVEGDEAKVRIVKSVAPGTNIRPVGCDLTPGLTLLHTGQLITPAEIGLLASVGINDVHVYAKPIVGVLSTGDEIVDASTPGNLSYGQIRDANRPMLLSLVSNAGGVPVDLGLVGDVLGELESHIRIGLDRADILVLSGGVSMGKLDLLKPILEKLGEIHFGRLNMKPGKPTTFASVQWANGRTKLIFGLPGNPVSSLVTAQLLLVPAIKAWRGMEVRPESHGYPFIKVRLECDLTPDIQRPEYHRVHMRLDPASGEWLAMSTGNQMSSRLMSVCACNGLVIVPAGSTLTKGSTVSAMLTGDLSTPRFQNNLSKTSKAEQPTTTTTASSNAPPPALAPSPSPAATPAPFNLRVSVLTVSDRCSRGEAVDASGPAIQNLLRSATLKNTIITILASACVADDVDVIRSTLTNWCDLASSDQHPHLILTTGGTGFSPRDVTPEAVTQVIQRHASGIVHAMMTASLAATPMGALSRPVAGARDKTLILTLPGSPKAIPEILTPILNILPHACKLLQDRIDPHVSAAMK